MFCFAFAVLDFDFWCLNSDFWILGFYILDCWIVYCLDLGLSYFFMFRFAVLFFNVGFLNYGFWIVGLLDFWALECGFWVLEFFDFVCLDVCNLDVVFCSLYFVFLDLRFWILCFVCRVLTFQAPETIPSCPDECIWSRLNRSMPMFMDSGKTQSMFLFSTFD